MAPSPENDNTPKAPDKNDKGVISNDNRHRDSGNGNTDIDTNKVCKYFQKKNK